MLPCEHTQPGPLALFPFFPSTSPPSLFKQTCHPLVDEIGPCCTQAHFDTQNFNLTLLTHTLFPLSLPPMHACLTHTHSHNNYLTRLNKQQQQQQPHQTQYPPNNNDNNNMPTHILPPNRLLSPPRRPNSCNTNNGSNFHNPHQPCW